MTEAPPDLTLYYAPRTRAFTALWLLEELEVEYSLEPFDIASGRHQQPDYLALNPMGKVPLVVHGETPVAETGAIAIYLADLYRDVNLAPEPSEPARAEYLRWIFFAAAIIEPCLGEKLFKWNLPAASVAWGSFERMEKTALEGIKDGTWLLGADFSACDVVVGAGLRFGVMFGAIDKTGPIADYVSRLEEREAFKRAAEIEKTMGERFPPNK